MIYFDNSATTKPYPEVLQSFLKVSSEYYGNPSSLHQLGVEAERLLSQARKQVAELLNVRQQEIFFTSGGTESNNLAIKGTALMYHGRGKHIITSAVEHASVREAYTQLKELGFRVTVVPVDEFGRVSVEHIEAAICHDTILVSIMHINNEVGTIQPIREIGELLRGYPKILFHVDDTQGVTKVPLDLHNAGIDFCSISGHKFHGLKGTGALFIREGVEISPLFSGGNQEWKRRSGTENVGGAVAMAKALRLGMAKQAGEQERLYRLHAFIRKELSTIPRLTVHTPDHLHAPHILNFSIQGFKGEVFVHALEEKGLIVSTTSACSSRKKSISHSLRAMNVPEELAQSSIRISFSYENTASEAKLAVAIIKETVEKLSEVMKI